MKKEMLSNSSLKIAVWDVLWIIRCSRYVSEVTFRGLEIRDLEIQGMGSWT